MQEVQEVDLYDQKLINLIQKIKNKIKEIPIPEKQRDQANEQIDKLLDNKDQRNNILYVAIPGLLQFHSGFKQAAILLNIMWAEKDFSSLQLDGVNKENIDHLIAGLKTCIDVLESIAGKENEHREFLKQLVGYGALFTEPYLGGVEWGLETEKFKNKQKQKQQLSNISSVTCRDAQDEDADWLAESTLDVKEENKTE